jgi:hypothetical protein
VWIEGHDLVKAPVIRVSEGRNEELDLEVAQVNAFQFNGVGSDREDLVIRIILEAFELFFGLEEFLEDLPDTGNGYFGFFGGLHCLLAGVVEVTEEAQRLLGQARGRGGPTLCKAEAEFTTDSVQFRQVGDQVLDLGLDLAVPVHLGRAEPVPDRSGEPAKSFLG